MKKAFLPLAVSLTIFLSVFAANAGTHTVTSTADTNDGVCDANCTFREAVSAENSFGQSSTIFFAPALNGSTITITSLIPIFQSLTVIGPAANQLTISGGGSNAIFDVVGDSFTMTDLTITGGNGNGVDDGIGGALKFFSSSTVVTFNRVHFTGNSASSAGGAFYFQGTTLNITNSTFSLNSSQQCGAISLGAGTTTITNTTFSGNTGTSIAGALCAGGTTILRNTTMTGNTGDFGGAIMINSGDTLNLGNSVIAGNTATTAFPEIWRPPSSGVVISAGNNHIGDSAGDATDNEFAISWAGTDTLNSNPMLGALTISNGGSTPTRTPTAGSPLINTGSNALAAGITLDQRGFVRVAGGTVDKGAVEFAAIAPTAAEVSISGRVFNASGRVISGATVILIDGQGIMHNARTNPFGYYYFDGLRAGETCVLNASAKGLSFEPQAVLMNDDLTGHDMIALPEGRNKEKR